MAEMIEVQEHLYDAAYEWSNVVDFGFDMEAVILGKALMPSQGVRRNSSFNGELIGSKIKGKVVGTDYSYGRADGFWWEHLYAILTTPV